jgi:hypothetical protein
MESLMKANADFTKTSLFNDYLSSEPNFGRIHLAGQYL